MVHTAEGSRTVQSLGAYFAKESSQVSSHAGIDGDQIEQYVAYDQEAWTLRNGNPISENVELCAFAIMKRVQWLSESAVTFYHSELRRTVTVDSPMNQLRLTADWIKARCKARGIPIVKLSPAEVHEGKAGVIGHIDWTLGMHDGTHSDPGPGFPWDVVMQMAGSSSTPGTSSGGLFMSLTPDQEQEILNGVRALKGGVVLPARSGNCRVKADDPYGHTMNGEAEAADGRVAAEKALAAVTALTNALKAKGII